MLQDLIRNQYKAMQPTYASTAQYISINIIHFALKVSAIPFWKVSHDNIK